LKEQKKVTINKVFSALNNKNLYQILLKDSFFR